MKSQSRFFKCVHVSQCVVEADSEPEPLIPSYSSLSPEKLDYISRLSVKEGPSSHPFL